MTWTRRAFFKRTTKGEDIEVDKAEAFRVGAGLETIPKGEPLPFHDILWEDMMALQGIPKKRYAVTKHPLAETVADTRTKEEKRGKEAALHDVDEARLA